MIYFSRQAKRIRSPRVRISRFYFVKKRKNERPCKEGGGGGKKSKLCVPALEEEYVRVIAMKMIRI
jgi:hypothetical protein